MTALTIQPHPVLLDGYREIKADLIPGESLKAFVSRHVADLEDYEIAIGGIVVRRDLWAHVRPKHGQLIEVRSATGRSVVALIAMAALFYFTMGAGAAWIGGAFGVGATSASFIGAGLYLAGSVLINKFIAPKPPSFSGAGQMDATYNLAGQRNTFRPYEPVPLLFGRCKITPDLATDQPYTFYRGNDQYLALTLNCGINVDRVDDLYQGDALLSSFEGVETYFSGFDGLSEEAIPLYSNTDTVAGGSLDSPPNAYIERTSAADSIRLEIDLEYNIYDFTSKGDPRWNSEGVTAQYRAVGSTTWLTFDSVTLSGDRPKLKRHTLSKVVPEGQYEVRVKRNAQDTDGSGAHCEVSWVALRSIQADATNYKGLSRIGVTCKATGQLNGSLDELKCVAYSEDLEYWNGSAWVTDGTHISNPGAQVLQYARGFYDEDGALIAGMGLDDSKIDLDAIKAFILHCASNSYTYDFYLKEKRNHQQVLDAICAAGFGNITWSGGKLSVVWADSAQPLEAVANMATIKKAQFQVDYTLAGMADGIVATYLDASDWTNKEIRIAAPGVTTPLNPASIALEGITDEATAAKMARYHLGQSLYQWKSISFGTDIEHLGYQRMSLLSLSHDLTRWGASGRVQAAVDNAGVVTLTLDEPVPAPGVGVTPYIGLRIPGEGPFRVFEVQSFAEDTDVITLADAWPVDAAFPGDSADNPATDTIWVYDFSAEPGLRVRVVEVQPESDLKGAQVVVAPESDEFWTYVETGTYTPPVPSGLPATRPVASNVQAVETEVVQGNTTFSEIQVSFDITGRMDHAVILAQYTDAFGNTDGIVHKVAETRTTEATFRSSGAGTYAIVVRPHSVDGIAGGVATLEFLTSNPSCPSFDTFAVTEVAGGLRRYSWSYDSGTIAPPDLAGCEIRYVSGLVAATEPDWETMTVLGNGDPFPAPFESATPVAGDWTIAFRATTTSGVQSQVDYLEVTLANNLGEKFTEVDNAILDAANDAVNTTTVIIGSPAWSSGTTYAEGDYVSHNNVIYRSKSSGNLNHQPPNATYWEVVGTVLTYSNALAGMIDSLNVQINEDGTGILDRLEALQLQVDDPVTGLGTTFTWVSDIDFQINDPGTGIATKLETLTGTVTDPTTGLVDRVTVVEGWEVNLDELYASWTVTFDVNGYVSGWSSVNNGSSSTIAFNVDNLIISKPGGVNRLELSGGVISAVHTNTLKMGSGFGVSNQMVMWYGANQLTANCQFSNAIWAVDIAGKLKAGGLWGNFGSGWSSGGSITSSYNSSSPATVTINVAAGTYKVNGVSINYNASSGTVSQTRDTTDTYYLYYSDAGLSGGSKSLGISTNPDVTFENTAYVLIGSIEVTVPAAGSGAGPGRDPYCVHVDSGVLVLRDGEVQRIRAGDVVVGDQLPGWGEEVNTVTHSQTVQAEGVRLTDQDGHTYTCSASAIWKGMGLARVLASQAKGRVVCTADGIKKIVSVEALGMIPVQHITAANGWYLAGDSRLAYHHNLKQMV